MKRITLLAILLSGFAVVSNAQTSYWTISWPVSVGMGATNDYISATSFRGIGISGRSFLTDNLSIGGEGSWEVFNEIKRDLPPRSLDLGNGVYSNISGTEYRYLNTLPLFVNAHYYLGSNGSIRPFAGLGIGTVYVDQRTDIGLLSFQNNNWRFGLQPEIGVFIPFGLSPSGVNLSARYRYGTKASDADAISMFSFTIGLGIMN
ncbi:MAG: outer membrane beta-barrel protein [Cyclobacteriaceae bacterium]|nr:outer membrane beta-barrel protein [Cyclobacteriaceae bacterium]